MFVRLFVLSFILSFVRSFICLFIYIFLLLFSSGDYLQASKHFEAYHELASDNMHWANDEGVSFYTDACINLYNIYTVIGTRLEDTDPESSLQLLLKAYQMAAMS